MAERTVDADPQTVTVRVPISIRRHGGRKLVLAPDGTSDICLVPARRVDNGMVKAIARAFRSRDMLENGTHATVEEIAVAEKIHSSYVSRICGSTLLAPEFVEGILDGRQPAQMTLAVLMRRFPMLWSAQRSELLFSA